RHSRPRDRAGDRGGRCVDGPRVRLARALRPSGALLDRRDGRRGRVALPLPRADPRRRPLRSSGGADVSLEHIRTLRGSARWVPRAVVLAVLFAAGGLGCAAPRREPPPWSEAEYPGTLREPESLELEVL